MKFMITTPFILSALLVAAGCTHVGTTPVAADNKKSARAISSDSSVEADPCSGKDSMGAEIECVENLAKKIEIENNALEKKIKAAVHARVANGQLAATGGVSGMWIIKGVEQVFKGSRMREEGLCAVVPEQSPSGMASAQGRRYCFLEQEKQLSQDLQKLSKAAELIGAY